MLLGLAVAVAATGLVHVPAAGADAAIGRGQGVDALGHQVVWVQYDRPTDTWRLMTEQQEGPVALPVRPFSPRGPGDRVEPPDFDLGRDARGRLVAAYARCHATGPGCDLYLYDFARRRERRLRVSRPDRQEWMPTVSGNRVVFVGGSSVGEDSLPRRVYRGTLTGKRSHRLAIGPVGVGERFGHPTPDALELSGRRLASVWDANDETQMVLQSLGSSATPTLVDRGHLSSGSGTYFVSPSLANGALYYGRVTYGDGGATVESYDLRTQQHRQASIDYEIDFASGTADSIAQDGRRTFYSAVGQVRDAGVLRFVPRPF